MAPPECAPASAPLLAQPDTPEPGRPPASEEVEEFQDADEHDSECSNPDHEVDCEDCEGMFLPQYLLRAQILVPARDETGAELPGEFELDNTTLLPLSRAKDLPDYNGWFLHVSPGFSNRHPTKFAAWGTRFHGRLVYEDEDDDKCGWLLIAAVTI